MNISTKHRLNQKVWVIVKLAPEKRVVYSARVTGWLITVNQIGETNQPKTEIHVKTTNGFRPESEVWLTEVEAAKVLEGV